MRPPPTWALSLAMALGAGLALVAVFVDVDARARTLAGVPEQAVARVEDQLIPRADYERAAAALAADLRRPLGDDDRRELVEGLVDELLLVEHGLSTGLPKRDPYLRTQISRAVLDRLRARVQTGQAPSEAELLAHYEQSAPRFAARGRVRLEALFIADTDPARAQTLAARWTAGEALADLRAQADTPPFELPAGPLSPAKLRDYLGPVVSARALELAPGQVSEPLVAGEGLWILRMVDTEPGAPRPFAEVREAVAVDLERSRSDAALRELLDELRADARVEIAWDRL